MSSGPSEPATALSPSLKKASTACTACQARKSKCTGGHPCDRCRAKGAECVVDESTDGRRKLAIKKKQQEWESDRDALKYLVDTLRGGSEEQVATALDVIRGTPSMEKIKASLDASSARPELQGSIDSANVADLRAPDPAVFGDPSGSSRLGIMDMHRLVDTPLFDVPASPWTSVTDDDQLVSHLVSLWFTWVAPWLNIMDTHAFIQDMQDGSPDAGRCSPFLVNAMLAHACVRPYQTPCPSLLTWVKPYSDYAAARTTPAGVSDLMARFLAEAKYWLDQEAGRVSLTSAQGLAMLYLCVSSMGRDRQGFVYMRQLSDMVRELDSTHDVRSAVDHSENWASQALCRLCWALWMSVTSTCLAWHRLPLLDQPTRDKPVLPTHGDPEDDWVAYPQPMSRIPGHSSCLFDAYASLVPLMKKTLHLLLEERVKSTPSSFQSGVESMYDRLERWRAELPSCLNVGETTPFQITFLHLNYHHLVILMYSYLKSPSSGGVMNSKGKTASRSSSQLAHERCLQSAFETSRLFNAYRATWGAPLICEAAIQWVAVALFTLFGEDLQETRFKTAFLDLCVLARSLARRWPFAKGVLRLVQLTAIKSQEKARYRILPSEVEEILEDFETQLWQGTGGSAINIRRQFSSFYPNLVEVIRRNERESRRYQPLTPSRSSEVSEESMSSGSSQQTTGTTPIESESPPVVDMDTFLEKYESKLTVSDTRGFSKPKR